MAPMNRNRNRDHKKTAARRRGKNLSRVDYKYSGSDGSRIRKKIVGHKLELFSGRNRNGGKSRKMGIGRFSRIRKEDHQRSAESDEVRTKNYIRKALKLGLSAGYLIPDENSESQVLRVASDIVKFGRLVEEGSGSDEKPDNSLTGGRNRGRRGVSGKTAIKRLATKNGRSNIRKRGRSRAKSPTRPVAQNRRRKRSDSRGKVKARIQKRKRMPAAKQNEPRTRKNEDDDAEDDKDDAKDEDDEPDTENNDNKNSNDENKKLPVAGRPSSIAPKSDNDSTTSTKQKNNDKEGSDNERSSEEGGDDEDEEPDYQEQPEGLAAEEDTNEDNEDQNAEN